MEIIRIAVVLAADVLNVKDDIQSVINALNQGADVRGELFEAELVWIKENENASIPFYRESPRRLFDAVNAHCQPSLIIGVFGTHFGAVVDPTVKNVWEMENDKATQAWENEFNATVRTWNTFSYPEIALYFNKGSKRVWEGEVLSFWQFLDDRNLRDKYEKSYRPGNFERDTKATPFLEDYLKDTYKRRMKGDDFPETVLPDGWKQIGRREVRRFRADAEEHSERNQKDVIDYFDGKLPDWNIAATKAVPRRALVKTLETRIGEAADRQYLRVTLLTGPGGEGKSTLLLQTAIDLVEKHPNINIIWHEKTNSPLETEMVKRLEEQSRFNFVIVSDEAEVIAKTVYDLGRLIGSSQKQDNVQFLLASRTTDWVWANAPVDADWFRTFGETNYDRQIIQQLDKGDAELVVQSWEMAGALGDFADEEKGERAQRLVDYAKAEGGDRDGSFLGAMLLARKSKTLEGYVEGILQRLKGREAFPERLQKGAVLPPVTLKAAFAHIAALHADNHQVLNLPVLQQLFSCSVEHLLEYIIRPLADEAAVDASTYLVLARHRAIAETAKHILTRDPGFEQNYRRLSRAAMSAWLNQHIHDDEISLWNRLPREYDNKRRECQRLADALRDAEKKKAVLSLARNFAETAIALAQGLMEAEPEDAMAVSRYANVLRSNNKVIGGRNLEEEAVKICRANYDHVFKMKTKGYFTEWAACESAVGHDYITIWLSAIGVSDFVSHLKEEAPIIFQSGFTVYFENLYNKPTLPSNEDKELFLIACIAASQLGSELRSNPSMKNKLPEKFELERTEKYLAAGESLRVRLNRATQTSDEAIDNLLKGIKRAYELRNEDDPENTMPTSLPDFSQLTFNDFRALFGVPTDFYAAKNGR